MRLIDAHSLIMPIALYMAENAYLNDTALDVLKKAAKWVETEPTVDAVEVVHGRWNGWHGDKRMKNGEYRHFHYYACDQCECRTAIASNYCPHCGAKMDAKEE